MKPFTELQILSRLKDMEGWEYKENAIHTLFEFDNFKDAFSMMTRIAFEVEKLNHHPDWSNVYSTLQISLSTHDAGGVTEKDFQLAKMINALVA
jgi:4a-hydroxytetrahydrobiopterin dehydratase